MAKGIAVEGALGPESRLLPEMLGEELWQAAGAALVELSKAEFAEALETIGAKDNFGLDPEKQANERQREMFWRALHLEELAIARGCVLGRESAWRCFLAQYRRQLTRVPTLVLQGDEDQVVPYKDVSLLQAKPLKHGTLKIYPGHPHGRMTTNADVINADILAFIKGRQSRLPDA